MEFLLGVTLRKNDGWLGHLIRFASNINYRDRQLMILENIKNGVSNQIHCTGLLEDGLS